MKLFPSFLACAALSVFVCGLSAFLIRVVPATENVTVVLSCVFNGVAIFGWNALDVISTSELFPVHLRYVTHIQVYRYRHAISTHHTHTRSGLQL